MLKTTNKIVLGAIAVSLGLSNLFVQSVSAQVAPSLGDGIICVAKGQTDQGNKIYFYTSLIDGASINRKQPVTVTMVEPASEITEDALVVINKEIQSVTFDAFGAVTPPEMQPVGLALTTYQGNNTFKGKSQAGSPLSFTLDNNYRVIKIQHTNTTYTGVCH
jgi:hypothetical protein